MKKRLFATLLSLVLIVALFAAFSGTAFADNTFKYTLKNGDTVLKVCMDNKIDFYKFQEWITKTNNITNYSNLKVGQVIILPTASVKDVSELTGAATTAPTATTATTITATVPGSPAATTTTVPGATTTTTATTAAAAAATSASAYSGDFVSGYLVNYTLKSGDTIYSVCKKLGIDFDANIAKITQLNNIKNYKNLKVGQTIVIPSTFAPETGSYTKIVAHKVVKGDTVLAICNNYGISYGANEAKIKELNNKSNLGAIQVGQVLYIPVPGTAAVNTAAVAATTTTPAGTTTVTPVNTAAATTPVNSNAPTYMIHTSSNGTFVLQVNGANVNTAHVGDKVKIVATPDSGYYVSNVTVAKTNASESVPVASDLSFTMPAYEVTVYVRFAPLGKN